MMDPIFSWMKDSESVYILFTLWLFKEVATFKGFIHTEAFVFHSLWSFKESDINGGFNFEWNLFEFLRLDYIGLWRLSLLEV